MPADVLEGALEVVQTVLQYLGTVSFAISGALAAGRRRMDAVGVVVLGSIVAVGGGSVRDLLLGRPAFWIDDPTFLLVGALAALLSIPAFRIGAVQTLEHYRLIQVFDAGGLALFVVSGTNVALTAGAGPVAAAVLGTITGIGGGIIRDMMASQVPTVLSDGKLYATAAMAGALTYVALLQLGVDPLLVFWVPILLILVLRGLSLRYGWKLPRFDTTTPEDDRRRPG